MNNVIIRHETPADYHANENLVRESFWNVYRPGCTEHYVLHMLRNDPDFIPELDFVMEKDGMLIGQVIAMHARIVTSDGQRVPVLTFGPIGIHPDYKRQGYGKLLLDHFLEEAAKMGFDAVCIEGNIDFYGKSGFILAGTKGIRYHGEPDEEIVPYFLLKELRSGYLDGVSGVYHTPDGYVVFDEDVEAFDKAFPPKEKLKLPGQLFS